MNEREQTVQAEIQTLLTMATLQVSIYEMAILHLGVSMALLEAKIQAEILAGLYEGVVKLSVSLAGSWDEALRLTRGTAAEVSTDGDVQVAYARFIRETRHLYR